MPESQESITPAEKVVGKTVLSAKFWAFIWGVVGAASTVIATMLSWSQAMATKTYVDGQLNIHDHGYAEPVPRDSRGKPAPIHQDLVEVDADLYKRVKALQDDLQGERATSHSLARRLVRVAAKTRADAAVEAFDDAISNGLGVERAMAQALRDRPGR